MVLATGVFDLLHIEHRRFLAAASAVGDILVVGIECDQRVREIKGPGRPRQKQPTRLRQLQSLAFVDVVFVLPRDFSHPAAHRSLLQILRPAVLAVSQHSPHQDKKAALMTSIGGALQVVHAHNPAISTTKLLE